MQKTKDGINVVICMIPFLVLSLSFFSPSLHADNQIENKSVETKNLEEIDGILTDQTITLIGREFFDHFSSHWRLNKSDTTYNLAIFERPSARWGSMVWVEYRTRKVFSSFLRPNTENIDSITEKAVRQIQQNLKQIKFIEAFGNDHDLAKDEF